MCVLYIQLLEKRSREYAEKLEALEVFLCGFFCGFLWVRCSRTKKQMLLREGTRGRMGGEMERERERKDHA
jgi:hypothetical protein